MAATGIRYFKLDTKVYKAKSVDGTAIKVPLLWGDEVFVTETNATTSTVRAKGVTFEVPTDALTDERILSWYQIDCGQGDAALIQLPDGRWIMVDGGPGKTSGPVTATKFLRWKMFVDQDWKADHKKFDKPFRLSALVVSHPDEDHFGGLADLNELVEGDDLVIDAVFHSGLGRFTGIPPAAPTDDEPGFSQLGPVELGSNPKEGFLTQLVDSFDDVRRLAKKAGARKWTLAPGYGTWLQSLAKLKTDGKKVGKLQRVDRSMGTLPGFRGGSGKASIAIIGPVVEPEGSKPRLRVLDGLGASALEQPSLTRNGHSVTLRIDYEDARLMLTGDLNFAAQALLMQNVTDDELTCHVAKACHHGSEDVSWTFLQKLQARATIFSSGDNEEHAHPRAAALGMAAALGRASEGAGTRSFLGFTEQRMDVPLIYSTELARSVELYAIGDITLADKSLRGVKIANKRKTADGEVLVRAKSDWLLANKLIYGLVNVRTDGKRILIGVLNEGKTGYQLEEITL